MTEHPGETPETEVRESDPNGDSSEGLAGDIGVSSERRGRVRGLSEEVTYGASPHQPGESEPDGDALPEQSAYDGQPDANPESPGAHKADPDSNPGHGL